MITFVTHLRHDHQDRIDNLNAIIDYYSSNILECKFIFVEDDKEHNPIFDSVKFIKGQTKFLFIKNDLTYYRTRALNIGIKQAESDVVVSMDTDCIVPINSILKCKNQLLKDCTAAWPYNGYFIDVSSDTRNKCLNFNFNYQNLLNELDSNYKMPLLSLYKNFIVRCTDTEHLGTGGFVMFNKKRFLDAGGYNQKMIGWGCEDNELVSRLDILEHKTFRDTSAEAICFHLAHRSAQRADNPFFEQNSQEWHNVKNMNKEKLTEYISTWGWNK